LAELPYATIDEGQQAGRWSLGVGVATSTISAIARQPPPGSRPRLPFDVVAQAAIAVEQPANRFGYSGRSHSLWYGDVQNSNHFQWFEVAFMTSPLIASSRPFEPYALDPSAAVGAISPGLTTEQTAWPFTPLVPDALIEFIDRWAGWLAKAAQHQLEIPSSMPERNPHGSWRTS
jgi:serine/threonine-protein kinase